MLWLNCCQPLNCCQLRDKWFVCFTYGAGDGNRTHVRSLGSLQSNSKNAGLAAFLRFSERLNWKIMENGKRPARGERKLLQSARRPGTLQERISAFPALSNRESHTSRFPSSLPFNGHKRVYREQSANPEALLPVCPSSARNRRQPQLQFSPQQYFGTFR